ncbi:hypothetical protein SAMN06298216_3904 [Spirosomataceae bacterium TFI 002]|nr:hypothetical protein SAMN06298216_3904 [Spirosomataceae bacterium TFI 002]
MKNNMYYYDTVTEALKDLENRGYTTDFEILRDKECLVCNKTSAQLSPRDFEIDETYRFEGDSDPGDEMIVFAISSRKNNLKGTVVNAYGMYADASSSKIVELLLNKAVKVKPIKRNEFLKPISREHHHGLLLSWKIRTGIKKEIAPERIKKYTDWFWEENLKDHFEIEEKYIFPILGNEHPMVKKALSQHRRLKRLFEYSDKVDKYLSLIEEELESHIRFEERTLFNEIQNVANKEQLQLLADNHTEHKFEDNLTDPFWG